MLCFVEFEFVTSMVVNMLYKNIYIVIALLSLFACVKSNTNNTQSEKVLNTLMTDTSSCLITTDEFVLFWDKFSNALLVNDTNTLSNLIDDHFHFDSYKPLFEHSKICKMNFENDSTISKQRFLKEFRSSLNPVYLQLIKQYEIRKHLEMKSSKTLEDMINRYICKKSEGKDNYYLYTYFYLRDYVLFEMAYKYDNEYAPKISIGLKFYKRNNEIKLHEMDFYYSPPPDEG